MILHYPFAKQHALKRQAGRGSGQPQPWRAPEIIETDADGPPLIRFPPDLDHNTRKTRIAKAPE